MAGLMASLRQKGVCLAPLDVSVRTPSLRDAEALARLLANLHEIGFPLEGGDDPNQFSEDL